MCGIAGIVYVNGEQANPAEVEPMIAQIVHRGPDQGAVAADGAAALGNRRLAILDLSPAGALPMRSHDGRYTLAYNGELYNHLELRERLPPLREVRWRSTSDAETLIELYRAEGLAGLRHVRGMFAFALWDAQTGELHIARDRMGEKPLYYYLDHTVCAFASEIKALLAHPLVPRQSRFERDTAMLPAYLSFGYLPAPETAFSFIQAVLPGQTLTIRTRGADRERIKSEADYWRPPTPADSAPDAADAARSWAERVRAALEESVKQCLLSDVPLGAFLSGGLDSSLVVALMKRHAGTVKTFSIGFEGDSSFDETGYAEQVARHLGTEHTAFTVKADALDLLPKLVWHHDQPFADSSAIPTYLVSKLTREHVTVALTGDGGDELFAGYERFYAAGVARRLQQAVPARLIRAGAGALNRLPEGTGYYNLLKRAKRFLNAAALPPSQAYFDLIRVFSFDHVKALLNAERFHPETDLAGAMFEAHMQHGGSLPDLLFGNMRTYLPDDLLIKTDRAAMAASLEGRAPFLDHALIELAAQIPANLKLKGRTTKFILKESARGLLPDSIIDRPKHGFGVPLGAWLRRDSRIVREILLDDRARDRGLLHMPAVRRLIDDHVEGRRDHGGRLWALLTLEAWHRAFIDSP
ncbi:MAG: asparagine synthase (glutamine-hydrolyzing) [bacterium]|nr:asparagine synthase (glutamine-hydrolyzing) [bacterium]